MPTAKRPKGPPTATAKSAAHAASSTRRRSGKAVAPPEALLAELDTLVDNRDLWLNSPNSLFGGRTPGELMGTEEELRLREWIGSVKHGMFS